MNEMINFENVNDKIISIRNENVILDGGVAILYGVETRDINKAVKNNPDKFPEGYIFELTPKEKQEVIENLDNLKLTPFMAGFDQKTPNKGSKTGVITNCDNLEITPSNRVVS